MTAAKRKLLIHAAIALFVWLGGSILVSWIALNYGGWCIPVLVVVVSLLVWVIVHMILAYEKSSQEIHVL